MTEESSYSKIWRSKIQVSIQIYFVSRSFGLLVSPSIKCCELLLFSRILNVSNTCWEKSALLLSRLYTISWLLFNLNFFKIYFCWIKFKFFAYQRQLCLNFIVLSRLYTIRLSANEPQLSLKFNKNSFGDFLNTKVIYSNFTTWEDNYFKLDLFCLLLYLDFL